MTSLENSKDAAHGFQTAKWVLRISLGIVFALSALNKLVFNGYFVDFMFEIGFEMHAIWAVGLLQLLTSVLLFPSATYRVAAVFVLMTIVPTALIYVLETGNPPILGVGFCLAAITLLVKSKRMGSA